MVEPRLWRKRILVTRPRARASSWVEGFASLGADVILFPVFSLEIPDDDTNSRTLATIDRLAKGPSPWLAFTSVTGVRHLMAILARRGRTLPEGYSFGCVGETTARELERHGRTVDLVPETATGVALARAIVARDARATIVHPTSSAGLGEVERIANESNVGVESVVVSEHRPTTDVDAATVIRELDGEGIDLLTFASPSAAHGLCERVEDERLKHVPALSVGPTTEAALRELGFARVETAATPAIADVLAAAESVLTDEG